MSDTNSSGRRRVRFTSPLSIPSSLTDRAAKRQAADSKGSPAVTTTPTMPLISGTMKAATAGMAEAAGMQNSAASSSTRAITSPHKTHCTAQPTPEAAPATPLPRSRPPNAKAAHVPAPINTADPNTRTLLFTRSLFLKATAMAKSAAVIDAAATTWGALNSRQFPENSPKVSVKKAQ